MGRVVIYNKDFVGWADHEAVPTIVQAKRFPSFWERLSGSVETEGFAIVQAQLLESNYTQKRAWRIVKFFREKDKALEFLEDFPGTTKESAGTHNGGASSS